MKEEILNRIRTLVGDSNVSTDSLLKDYTTFKVGGLMKAFVKVMDAESLRKLIVLFKGENVDYLIIGNGSNLLASDQGFDGVVIKLEGEFNEVSAKDTIITAGSGAILGSVCKVALDNSLTGLEFAYGIPGTIGGAMVMNAGAYDGEMKDVVKTVEAITSDGELITLSNADMKFEYRNSIVKKEGLIVTRVVMELKPGNKDDIKAKMDDLMGRRVSKQPLEFPSAGSTFKRPKDNFAGKLIMESGLSGFRVGGACVSPKHCGFVVNDQGASAKDIDDLMNEVIKKVKEDTGIVLEPEVIKIGRF
ncbi:MAG: UDP-N-acetylmuramate dehydrogenase [Lachnospiraceae bacterium]|nr:UDP-N-acetylmuramate dehydrogenase [Lachnospiraceae bacterium]